MDQDGFVAVARVEDVGPGQILRVALAGRGVLLCNSDGRLFAVANRCSHADEVLECGRMRGGWIACPVHGARFDLASGRALNPPAKAPIVTYRLRIMGDMIEIAPAAGPPPAP